AHMTRLPPVDGGVSLLQVEAHRARAERRVAIAREVALRRAHTRILEFRDEKPHPARPDDDVLIDLADDWIAGRANAGVGGRSRAALGRHDNLQRPLPGQLFQHLRRSIVAVIVHDDDLHRPAVVLRADGVERLADAPSAVVNGDDEADAFHHALAIMSSYRCSSWAHTTSPPYAARTRLPASAAAARHSDGAARTPSIARASASTSPSGTTGPPPIARITSPQPESSATMAGVPDKSDSSGTSPKISSSEG